jgi:phage terminase large subunit GpA-like protein
MPPPSLPHCLTVLARAAAPRRALTVSQWADEHRVLTAKQGGEPGRYRTARTPFLREIMDCFSATSRVREVVVAKSAQVGLTEATVNVLGYTMHHAPAPAMVLMPTLESRDAWKVQKLNPLLTDTPAITELLGTLKSRDATNRQDVIDFPGAVLFLSGGNSPQSYAQRSVSLLIMDDLDRFPAEIGDEGDPVDLARNRLKAFARSRLLLISTPTEADTSLIWREYSDTDRRRYWVPCPHCGQSQPLDWGGPDLAHGIKWSADLSAAWYVCAHCRGEIHEHAKPRMLREGAWVADNPGHHRRGYHISELYAPIGLGGSWLDLARDWHAARGNNAKLKTFVNTRLGEPWTEPGHKVDPTALISRLEDYAEPRRLARTAGVDVQKDRLEVTTVDWDAGEEAWIADHLILPGDTARPEVWEELGQHLADARVDFAAIDSGYNTSMVYEFVKARRWAAAVKGAEGPGRPIVEDEKVRARRLRAQRKKGVIVHLVGDDQAKALIYSRLQLLEPGPGYVHFPRDPAFDDEYFAQLTAEKLVPKVRGTRPVMVWVQTRARNEALDCLKYALAALRLAGINLKIRAEARAAAECVGLFVFVCVRFVCFFAVGVEGNIETGVISLG